MSSEVKIREALEKGQLLFSSNDRAENTKLIGRVMAQVAEDNYLSRYVVFLLACRAPNLLLEDVLIDPKSKQLRGVLTKDALDAVSSIREMTVDKDDYRFIEVLRMFKLYNSAIKDDIALALFSTDLSDKLIAPKGAPVQYNNYTGCYNSIVYLAEDWTTDIGEVVKVSRYSDTPSPEYASVDFLTPVTITKK